MRNASQIGLTARLAWRDYCHEWVMSGCFVLALGAVLIPLLVLFGLKYGIITNLLDPLKKDPRYREIIPSGSGDFTPEWFAELRRRDDVVFLVPRTRAIAASIKLRAAGSDSGRIVDVELVPSASGDPVLGTGLPAPEGYGQVVLAAGTAEKLGVRSGARLEGIVSRIRHDEQETVRLILNVIGVASPGAFTRDGLFVSVDLLVAIEDFRDGRAVPALGWNGAAPRKEGRDFAGFRLYARGIDDVADVRAALLAQGIDVRSRIADIALVKTLDRNLSIIFWIIAVIVVIGYCLSFGTSVWANVDRKRHEFSLLRLVGLRTRGIVWFPIVQALLTALFGWSIACIVYFLVQGLLNALFVQDFGLGQSVCRLLPSHLAATLVLALLVAALPASIGGLRLARMEPSIGLRGR